MPEREAVQSGAKSNQENFGKKCGSPVPVPAAAAEVLQPSHSRLVVQFVGPVPGSWKHTGDEGKIGFIIDVVGRNTVAIWAELTTLFS